MVHVLLRCLLLRLPPFLGAMYSLYDNSLGAEGAAAIAEALKLNNTLHTLE